MKRYLLTVMALVLTLPALAKDLSPKELTTYQSNGVVILDIRRNEEWTDTGIIRWRQNHYRIYKSRFIASGFSGEICEFGSKLRHTIRFVLQVW